MSVRERMGVRVGCAWALLAVCGLLAAPATAAWHGAVSIAMTRDHLESTKVGVNARGDAVVVWSQSGSGDTFSIRAAVRRPGGGWRAPVTIGTGTATQTTPGPEEFPPAPSVAVDSRGDAVVVWVSNFYAFRGFRVSSVRAAFKPAGGPWRRQVHLRDAGSDDGSPLAPQVAFDRRGNAIAVWTCAPHVQAAFRPVGGTWRKPVNISVAGVDPQVAFDARGDATAIWTRESWDGSAVVRAAFRPVGGVWRKPVTLGTGYWYESPDYVARLAVDPRGDAMAVWTYYPGTTGRILRAAFKPAGRGWQQPFTFSAGYSDAFKDMFDPQVALDRHGNATVIWVYGSTAGPPSVLQATGKPLGGSWQTPLNIATSTDLLPLSDYPEFISPALAVDTHGTALVMWGRHDGTLATTSRTAHGPWRAPTTIPGHPRCQSSCLVLSVDASVDGRGNAVAVWIVQSATGNFVQAATSTGT